jgi:hypothetical protein
VRALEYWKAVTADRIGFLDRVVAALSASGTRYCVVDGQAVNASNPGAGSVTARGRPAFSR